MKKMNKKGFTLIELLAVIVILAIIMVIAVPQILDVIESSKTESWKSNVKLVEEALELNMSIKSMQGENNFLSTVCTENANQEVSKIADYSDTTVTCDTETKKFTLTGTGQFAGKTANIICTTAGCSSTIPAAS